MRALLLTVLVLLFSFNTQAAQTKDWTFLVFLNGHNNLDNFGYGDINEMEKVGSTNKINVIVQWASLKNKDTKRLYVTKDSDPVAIHSKVVQTLPRVDMGDVNSLVEFVQWGVKNYPAKHYFIDIWNHGSGWHLEGSTGSKRDGGILDNISWDDLTGHSITTLQLGAAMAKSAQIMGHPVDIYGSDACLMAMPEISTQMQNSVNYYVGSEEVEPGNGWPYDDLLSAWNKSATASPKEVSGILTDVYVKSYQSGSQGDSDVTFSTLDLKESRSNRFINSMKDLSSAVYGLTSEQKKAVVEAIKTTQVFTYDDYGDLIDFLLKLEDQKINSLPLTAAILSVKSAAQEMIVFNKATAVFANAHGAAIWLPSNKNLFDAYWALYQELDFHKATGWGLALSSLF